MYKGSLKGPNGQELFCPYGTDEVKRLFLKLLEKLKMKENVQNNIQVYHIMSNFSAQYCFKMNIKNYL